LRERGRQRMAQGEGEQARGAYAGWLVTAIC